MSGPQVLRIEARVHERERPGIEEAARQLHTCLAHAGGGPGSFEVRLTLNSPRAPIVPPAQPTLVVLSVMPEVERTGEPAADTTQRWLDGVRAWGRGGTSIYVRNVFRHVQDRSRDGTPTALQERIRRLNRMAVTLSQQTGVAVVDTDRAFADVGGRELQCDWRLQGPLATALSAHTTVLSFLSFGMDAMVDPGLQQRARAFHGGLREARIRIQQLTARG